MELQEVLTAGILTFIFSWLLGFERQNVGKDAGISSHILVGLGACALAVLQVYIFYDSLELAKENPTLAITVDRQRIIAQVVTGVGFIGAGIIMKSDKHVKGITTAGTLWMSAILGILFGSNYIFLGLIFGSGIVIFMYSRDLFKKKNPFIQNSPSNKEDTLNNINKEDNIE